MGHFWLHERKPRILKGSKHPNSKLSWKIVRQMREEFARDKTPYPQLSKKYGVTKSTVGKIIRNELWIEEQKEE